MKKAVNLLLTVLLTLCVLSVNVMANGPDNVSKHDITVRYVVNTDPKLIVPEEKTVFKGESFDPLEGVSATDEEDGDLTNKVSFSKNFNLNEKGTYTITYTVTDRFGGEAVKTLTLNVIEKIAEGNTSGEATLKENAPVEKVEAEIKSDAIVDSIVREGAEAKSDLTDDQKEAIKSGADVKLELVVDKSNPTTDEASKIEKAVKNKDSNTQIGTFLDVSLLCTVTQNNSQVGSTKKVKETGAAVKVSVTVPDTLVNKDSSVNRKYDVARLHNGTVELLGATYDSANKKLTFSTDRFSTYAIVYTDTKVEQAPVYIPNKKKPVVNTGYGFDSSVIDISEGSGSISFDVKGLKESEVLDVVLSASELVLKSKFSDSNDSLEATVSFEKAKITSDGNYTLNAELKDKTIKVAPGVYEASLKVTVTYNEYVAKIGDKYYNTLQSAIDAASSGNVVRLLKDITVKDLYSPDGNNTKNSTIVISGKGITLDGGNHAVTIDPTIGDKYLLTINNTTDQVVIKDIKFIGSSASKTNMNITGCSNVLLENVISSGGACSAVVNNSIVTIDGANTKLENGRWTYAVDVANGSTYNPQIPAVTVNNGIIGKLYFEGSGTGVITGGNIQEVSVKEDSTGSVKITGGTFSVNPHDYVADDALCEQNADGTYTVHSLSVDEYGHYLINTLSDLELFANLVNAKGCDFNGKTVKLTSDINLQGKEWTPIGINADSPKKFQGTFDGQGNTIFNLYVKQGVDYHAAGFFGALNGTAKNIVFESATVTNISAPNSKGNTDNGTSVVAGSIYTAGTIENVIVKNSFVSANRYVGGISGYTYGSVKNCTVENTNLIVTPDNLTDSYDNGDKVGGIVGTFWHENTHEISGNTVKNVTITGYRDLGGIAGYANGHVINNTVNGLKIVQDYSILKPARTTVEGVVGRHDDFTVDGSNSASNVNIEVNNITTNEQFDAALKNKTANNIVVNLQANVNYDVTPWISGNGTMGGPNTNSITINGNNNTITFNNTDNDWNGIYIANEDAVLTINNAHISNSGHHDGPWNRHDINFRCKVVLNGVVSDKSIAVAKDSALNKVDISDDRVDDDYLLWIQASGETVNLIDCNLHDTKVNGGTTRGIGIKDQYIDSPALVTLNVSGTKFATTKKAAVLVTSSAGATINWSDVNDISGVAADTVNAVWNDADRTAAWDLVTVTGCTKVQEK